MPGPGDYCPQRECAATVGNYLNAADWASVVAGVEIDLAAATGPVADLVVVYQAAAGASDLETKAWRTSLYLTRVLLFWHFVTEKSD